MAPPARAGSLSVDAESLPGTSSASWNLQGRWYRVSRHRPSDFRPITVPISQAEPRSSSGSPMNAANERASPWAVGLGPAAAPLVPALPAQLEARHPAYPRSIQRYMVEAETSNCPTRNAAMCAGESPRATSDLMAVFLLA